MARTCEDLGCIGRDAACVLAASAAEPPTSVQGPARVPLHDRAASTLQRHISARRQWSFFARASNYYAGSPSAEQVLDVLGAF